MITSMLRSAHTAKTWYRSMLAGNTAYSPPAFELISTTLISTSTASVSFSSIVGTYKHLQIRQVLRGDSSLGIAVPVMRFNADTGTNYARHTLSGNGTSVASSATTSADSAGFMQSPTTTDYAGASIIDILDYASTSKNKTVRNFASYRNQTEIWLQSGLWLNTTAITSISFTSGNNIANGSRFSLYGIKG